MDLTPRLVAAASLLAGLFALAAAPPATAPDRWPQFRGPGGRGVAPPAKVPLAWGPESVLWKVEVEGLGHSSPIVWGNRIFLTTAIEGDVIADAHAPSHRFGGDEFKHPDAVGADRHQTLKVMAYDTRNGALVWSRTAFAGRVYDDRHRASSYASPTPVTDGEAVYAYFGAEGVFTYDLSGEPRWQRDLGDIKSVGLGVGTSPVLYRDLLIIQADEDEGELSFIAALDRKTGAVVWRKTRPVQASWTTPTLHQPPVGPAQLLTAGNELLISYDPQTGDELWRAKGLGSNAIHTPLVHQNLAIFTAGYPKKITVAVALDRRGDRTAEAPVWQYDKGTAYVPSNLLLDGYLYLTSDSGTLTCLEAATGKLVYEGGRFPEGGRFTASLTALGDHILQVSRDGDAAFIKAGPQHAVIATTTLDEVVSATPAVAGDRLYVRSEKHLFAIGAR